MLSTTGKTTKRVVSKLTTKVATKTVAKVTSRAAAKSVKAAPRSDSHRDATVEWLKEDVANRAALLEAALETGDAGDLMAALRLITDAGGGVAKIAAETGLNREALYRTLSKNGNPQLSSLLPILQATGLKIVVQPII
jgi:probable addiction module antidote protein